MAIEATKCAIKTLNQMNHPPLEAIATCHFQLAHLNMVY